MLNWTHAMAHEEQLKEVRRQVAREHLAEKAKSAQPRGRKGILALILYAALIGLHTAGKALKM